MFDRDLAMLYGVETRILNQAVKRNLERFPSEFMFQLNRAEKEEVITNCDHLKVLKFSPALPFAFTEYGVAMLSSVLNSKKAIQINIQIINAFIKMREMLASYQELQQRIEDMEDKVGEKFKTTNLLFKEVFEEI